MRSLRTSHFNYPLPGLRYGLAAALLLFFTAFSAVAAAQILPGAPTGLTATVTEPSEPWQIDLSWTAPASNGGADISGYQIECFPDCDGDSQTSFVVDNPSTPYSHTRDDPGKAYSYWVSAINTVGTGPASNVADVAATPGAPTGLTATVMEPSEPWQIDLSWTAPASDGGAEISEYQIEYSPDGDDDSWTILTLVGNNPTSYSHTLDLGDAYSYRVLAINGGGTGPPSNVVRVDAHCSGRYNGQQHDVNPVDDMPWPYYTIDTRSRGEPAISVHHWACLPIYVCGHNGMSVMRDGDGLELYCDKNHGEWVTIKIYRPSYVLHHWFRRQQW